MLSKVQILIFSSKAGSELWCKSFLVETVEDCQRACTLIRSQTVAIGVPVIGFDTEWKPTTQKGGGRNTVALIQVATPMSDRKNANTESVFLFRVNKLNGIPDCLRRILEDADIVKVGVSIDTDKKNLKDDFDISLQSYIDLQFIFGKLCGLKKLSSEILQIDYASKAISNWECSTLSPKQVLYATADAFVGIEIFKSLAASKYGFNLCKDQWNNIRSKIGPYYNLSMDYFHKICAVCGLYSAKIKKTTVVPKSFRHNSVSQRFTLRLCDTCSACLQVQKTEMLKHLQYTVTGTKPALSVQQTLSQMQGPQSKSIFVQVLRDTEKMVGKGKFNRGRRLTDALQNLFTLNNKVFNGDQLWRDLFHEAMKPKFLPTDWVICVKH